MAFPVKAWQDAPSTSTPIDAVALENLETRVTNIGFGGVTSQTGSSYASVAGDVVLANPSSGGITVTLPTPVQSNTVTVVAGSNITTSNTVTVQQSSAEKIYGPSLPTSGANSFAIGQPGAQAVLTTDGTSWYIISGGPSAGKTLGGGYTNIATAQSTASTSFTTLTTPDQVQNIVLPANGLIAVWYQAVWANSTALLTSQASIFLNSTQLKIANEGQGTNAAHTTAAYSSVSTNYIPLYSFAGGLASSTQQAAGDFGGDVTTGQVVGGVGYLDQQWVLNGTATQLPIDNYSTAPIYSPLGGPCYIFAAAGTYTVSVQFLVTGTGNINVKNRKLWVQALAFS